MQGTLLYGSVEPPYNIVCQLGARVAVFPAEIQYIRVRCDMALMEPMHRNKPKITYVLSLNKFNPIQFVIARYYIWIA